MNAPNSTNAPDSPDAPDAPDSTPRERLAIQVAATAFVIAILGAVGFVLAYVLLEPSGWQPQALGGALFVAFAGLGTGLVVWSQGAMPQGPDVEERHAPSGQPEERAATEAAVEERTDRVGRRSLLGRLLAAALGVVGLSALAPLASLGPRPLPEDITTEWASGRRLVRHDHTPVHRDDLPVGGAIPVYPEGAERRADSQVMLIHVVPDGPVDLTSGRRDWTVAGHIAYSRLCTHMGCSVGLYQSETRHLVCPCHQSAFKVEDGGRPQFGPDTRPLPQLPIDVDDEGYLVATGGFDRPVGTASWDYPSRVEGSA